MREADDVGRGVRCGPWELSQEFKVTACSLGVMLIPAPLLLQPSCGGSAVAVWYFFAAWVVLTLHAVLQSLVGVGWRMVIGLMCWRSAQAPWRRGQLACFLFSAQWPGCVRSRLVGICVH